MFRQAWLLVGDHSAAGDLVQETLTRLYPKWPSVMCADMPEAYVRACITRQFLSDSRRRSAQELVVAVVPEATAADPTGELDSRLLIIDHLGALSSRQRAAIVLRYFEDLDDRAAAEAMHCPVATFRSHLRRGMAALRKAMTEGHVDEPPYRPTLRSWP